ncbi:dephospho-CoA kinase [Terrimonas rubra]|uniref:Dephospho-CoA kinase n=1 Tax=Terrimonas rubra TaxID=1035890 RepID=A0ABW6A871_9BACT
MLKVGITGGIGTGKTVVARIFETLGVPVYYADTAAKTIINTNPEVKQHIIAQFGPESYIQGKLNTPYISGIVFKDSDKLQALNSITHPVVIQHARDWLLRQESSYALKEAALLFESGSYKELDIIIGVASPFETRVERVMERDNISREAVLQKMGKQMDEEEKIAKCDYVIYNDEKQMVIPQVLALNKILQQKAANPPT